MIAAALLCAGGYGAYLYFAPGLPTPRATAPTPETTQAPATDASGGPLEQARAKFSAGDGPGAHALLADIIAGKSDAALLPQALVLDADIELAAGNTPQAIALLERATKEFPNSPEAPAANARYAKALELAGNAPEAEAIYAKIRDTAPKGMRAIALSGLARKAERENNLPAARDLFRQAANDATPGSPEWGEAVDGLGRLNVQLIFSTAETPESKYYTVEKGDNLTDIGIKLNTTQGLLTRANGMTDATRLNLGQRLKYTPKDFRIVVERSTCWLFLLDSEGIFKRYRTGLGMPGHETALGNYTIGNKQKDPVWHPSGRPPVAAGDPNNELGTRWMPMKPAEPSLPDDLGIHGTIAPETIGQYKSHGCPRLRKDDVEELYDLVVRSTPVQVVETVNWNEVLRPGPAPAVEAPGGGASAPAAVQSQP